MWFCFKAHSEIWVEHWTEINLIDSFCNLLFINVRTNLNHKRIELSDFTNGYTYSFYFLIKFSIITFYGVCTKLNNHIGGYKTNPIFIHVCL